MILAMKSSKHSMLTSTQQCSVDEHLRHVITEAWLRQLPYPRGDLRCHASRFGMPRTASTQMLQWRPCTAANLLLARMIRRRQ
ncbi:unnamed protein product [Symbiodinium microadriaticum]|nr:unnamed protein product [Symbiodinium microadriaticum]